jgi:tetratricopeptide (TPR) repeat protein
MKKQKYILAIILFSVSFGASAQGLEDARRAIDAEQYQRAKSMLTTLLRTKPKDGDLYYSLGEVYLKTGYVDSAKVIFAQGIRAARKNPLNYAGIGKADLQAGNLAAAKINFVKAVNVSSKRKYDAHLAIGEAYTSAAQPDFNAALPYLKKADELDKSDKDAQVFLAFGDFFTAQGKYPEALEQYKKALQLDSTLLRAKVQIGEMYFKAGQPLKADSVLKNLVATNSNYGPAYRLMSKYSLHAYLNDKNNAAAAANAVANYSLYLNITDRSFDSRLEFAELLYAVGDYRNLERELQALLPVPANNWKAPVVARLSGYAAYKNGNYPAAQQYLNSMFTSLADERKATANDYVYLSLTQQKLQLADAALASATKAIRIDSSKTVALEDIAKNYYNARNWIKAIETFELMKQLGGKPVNAGEVGLYHGTALYFRYVESFNRQEQPSQALLAQANAIFEQALRTSPDLITAHLWRARALLLMEDQQNPQGAMVPAYQAYIEAADRSSLAQTAATKRNLVEAYNAIAAFAFAKSDKEKARTYWNKALTLESQDPAALAGIRSLAGPVRSGRRK